MLTYLTDTSKLERTGAYGHRGLFLASLASLSLLTVTSRHEHHQSTSSVIFHHSKPVARLLPAPAHQFVRVGEHGTSVTVNDLFGNMPVRVKSRGLTLQKPDEMEKEWDRLKHLLVSLMLANPQLSKLVITDVERSKRVAVRLSAPATSEMDLGRIGSILAQSGMISSRDMNSWHIISATIPDLTIHAAISTVPSPSKKLQFISLGNDPVLSRSNSNILFNEINRLMSLSDFGNTGTASTGTPATPLSPVPQGSDAPGSMSGRSWTRPVNKWPMFYTRIDTGTIRHVSDDGDETSPDTEKSLQRITDILGAMILEFLKQQQMRPRITKRQVKLPNRLQQATNISQKSDGPSASFTKRDGVELSTEEAFSSQLKLPSFQRSQSMNVGRNFNNWSRVKAAKDPKSPVSPADFQVEDTFLDNDDIQGEEQIRLRSEFPRSRPSRKQRATPHSGQGDHILGDPTLPEEILEYSTNNAVETDASQVSTDRLISWIDPHTGKSHLINSRTGQTVDRKSSVPGLRFWPGSFAATARSSGHVTEPLPTSAQKQNRWVDTLLESWDNPTFTRTEKPVANLHTETNALNLTTPVHSCLQDIGSLDTAQVAKFRGKLRRHSLATAAVIAQVDEKFILAKLDAAPAHNNCDESDGVVVLIDQHAADERCRIEQLFDEMFMPPGTANETAEVRTVEIDPISFDVLSTEGALLRKYLDFFGKWGVHYDLEAKSGSGVTVSVRSLPLLIAERCRVEPYLVVDLLRREIWTSEEDDRRPLGSKRPLKKQSPDYDFCPSDEDESHFMETTAAPIDPCPWIQYMSGCPQAILDLLNSRACRGAIMFNDPLSDEECKVLVSRLARCAFPFQCAHGRPSMIPILDLRPQTENGLLTSDPGILMSNDDEHSDLGLGFLEAFKARYVR